MNPSPARPASRPRWWWWPGLGALVAVVGASCSAFVDAGSKPDVGISADLDGKRVVFSALDGDLYVLDLADRRVSPVGPAPTPAVEVSPRFTPDGGSVVYAATMPGESRSRLFVRPIGGEPRAILDDPAVSDASPSVSPDGKRVAFARAYRHRNYSMGGMTWDNFEICSVGLDGSDFRKLTDRKFYQADGPCFVDPDRIVFSADGDYPDGHSYLFSIPLDGSKPPERLPTPAQGADPKCYAWGIDPSSPPGGKQVAFLSDRFKPFHYDVFVADADGNNPRPLGVAPASRYNFDPTILAGPKAVLYVSDPSGTRSNPARFGLWSVPIEGGKPTQVADGSIFTDPLGWKPPAN